MVAQVAAIIPPGLLPAIVGEEYIPISESVATKKLPYFFNHF